MRGAWRRHDIDRVVERTRPGVRLECSEGELKFTRGVCGFGNEAQGSVVESGEGPVERQKAMVDATNQCVATHGSVDPEEPNHIERVARTGDGPGRAPKVGHHRHVRDEDLRKRGRRPDDPRDSGGASHSLASPRRLDEATGAV